MSTGRSTGTGTARRVAGNTVVRVAGEVFAKVASLAFYVVMARKLGVSDYGAFAFAMALTSSLLIGSGFGTDDLVAREVARDRSSAARHLGDAVALKAMTAPALIGAAMIVVVVGGYPATTRLTTLIVGVGAALEVGAKSWHAIFQANERLELVSVCLITQRVLTAAVGIALLLLGGRLEAAAMAYLTGSVGGVLAVEVVLHRVTAVRRRRPSAKGVWLLLRGGVPIGIAGLLLVLLLKIDVVLLSFLGDNRAVGLYAAGYRVVDGLQFLTWAFGAAMLPWLARASPGPALTRAFMLGVKLEAAALLPIGLALSCFARPIVQLLYGDGFSDAAAPLALLGGTVVCYGLQSFGAVVLIARDSAGTLVKISCAVAVFNVAGNLAAIPLWGARGAAAVALATGLLLAGLTVGFASRHTGGLRLGQALAGPAVAGVAMALAAVSLRVWPVLAAAAALAVYGLVFAAVELTRHREDARSYLRALPLRPRTTATWPAD